MKKPMKKEETTAGLTAGQKKLPKALQQAILKRKRRAKSNGTKEVSEGS
jgi:hypothetical protein